MKLRVSCANYLDSSAHGVDRMSISLLTVTSEAFFVYGGEMDSLRCVTGTRNNDRITSLRSNYL